MKIWQIIVTGLLGLAVAGCRTDPEVAYLQRDNRQKEQEIYRLRNRVEDLEESLNSTAPAQPGSLPGLPPGGMLSEPRAIDGGRSAPASTRPARSYAAPDRPKSEPEIPGPDLLRLSPGIESPPGDIPERMKVPGDAAPPRRVSPSSEPSSRGDSSGKSSQWGPAGGQSLVGDSGLADNSAVAQITLHPALTGGIGSGGRPGDEGLLVVVEPRDFGGNIVNAPGDISVALLDPAQSGERARLGRWDFPVAETQGMVRTGSQQGIHLRLPWTSTPVHDRLKVFVRYTTRDGRKLQAERVIAVALNAPPPARREAIPDNDPPQTATRPQWSPVR